MSDSPCEPGDPVGTDALRQVGDWFRAEGAGTTAPRPHGSGPADDLPKVILDRYEVIDGLGEGGMGIVLRVLDRQLHREVALKLLRKTDFASEEDLARLRIEARAAAAIHHAHVLPVHDLGELDGRPFYTMELVQGEDLSRLIARGGLSAREAAEIGRQVAEALEAGHAAGVLHRDVKPQNIMVDRRGPAPHAYLTDFGLAKLIRRAIPPGGEVAGQSLLTLTRGGAILGTPAFMSPEQVEEASAVDARSDVYSLGATLYAAITGQLPLRAPTLTALLAAIRERDPIAPRSLVPALDRDIETVVLKCLQKRPQDRYARAAELASDLQRYLAGEPVAARPVGPLGRAWRRARRRPSVAIPVALLVLSLVATGGTLLAKELLRRADLARARDAAWTALAARDYAGAVRQARAAEALDPGDPELVALVGRMHAEQFSAMGEKEFKLYREAQERETTLEGEWARDGPRLEDSTADGDRRALWEMTRRENASEKEVEGRFIAAADWFFGALAHWPEHPLAKERLGDLFWDMYVDAEDTGNVAGMETYAALVRQYAKGKYEDAFAGKGRVRVTIRDAATVEASLFRYDTSIAPPVLVPVPARPHDGSALEVMRLGSIGQGSGDSGGLPSAFLWKPGEPVPFVREGKDLVWRATLPRGSYLLFLPARAEWKEARYPFVISRKEDWEGGLDVAATKDLPGGDWVYVPEGPFVTGGDPVGDRRSLREARESETEAFLIARHETTCEEYLAYLRDDAWHGDQGARMRAPRGIAAWGVDAKGRPEPPAGALQEPVRGVSVEDADDFARWLTRRDGGGEGTFRLPTAREWEKAARGVDGRLFPWGNTFDPGFCRMRESPGGPRIGPVCAYPLDDSPYGVRDLAGGVQEWTSTPSRGGKTRRVVKGGAWCLPSTACHAALSTDRADDEVDPSLGFRLVAVPNE